MRLLNKKKKDRHGYLLVNNKNGDSSYVLYSAEFKNKKCVGGYSCLLLSLKSF